MKAIFIVRPYFYLAAIEHNNGKVQSFCIEFASAYDAKEYAINMISKIKF